MNTKLSNLELKNQMIELQKQTDKTCCESEEFFQKFIASTPTAIDIYRLEENNRLILTHYNPASSRMTGLKAEALLGKTIEEAFPNLVDTVIPDMYRAIARGELETQNYERFYKDDKFEGWYDISAFRIEKNTIGVEILEITNRKKSENELRESEKRIKIILETEPECVKILDLEGKLEYMNPAGLNMIDADNLDQIKGQSMLPLIKKKYQKSFSQLITKTLKGENGKLEFEIIGLKGRHLWLETSSAPLRLQNEEITGVLGVTRDITESKKAEKALKESERKLTELNATKDKLFSIIAHDLRSPFNSILGFSELLIENLSDNEITESKKQLGFIHSSAENSLVLLDNLLNWAKSQTGQISFNLQKLMLSSIIQEIIEISSANARVKNISLNHIDSDEIEVYADKVSLKIILRNLISNAIKFTKSGGNINVSVKTEKRLAEITISDNGVGIEADLCKKLFDIDTNITRPGTSNEKGSGLGLVLCKEFTEKLGGKIWVESIEGKGSDFKFTLPLNS